MNDDEFLDYLEDNTSSEKVSNLEELMSEALLIELVNSKKAEVFENVVFSGKRRYYIENLSERDYSLENTTPYQIEILGNVIEEGSWGILLCRVANLLLKLFPEHLKNITDFRCPWSKAAMFSTEARTNFKPIDNNLYLNCNHTALHSCWFIQDLLDYFNVDKSSVHFLIHRPCSAEPKSVKEYIEKRFKNGFVDFLCLKYGKTTEYAQKVIRNIDKYLNPMLVKISKSYTNLFLFDDTAIMQNYVKKIREIISQKITYDDKTKKILNRYLDYIVGYYKYQK